MRKSPQNNKFWVHHIYIEKGTERTSAGTSKSSKTAFIPFGATNSISQSENNVNTKNDESSNDIKYSMGELKAETADKSALEKAMELEKDGTDSEKIRKETGWFKGYDGKWRFEIDNSELEFKTDIEKNRAAAIELAKMKVKSAELEEKIANDTATKAEGNEYYNLDEKMIEYRKGVKLSDAINHPKLFEAYPQLKNVDVYYEISSVNRGVYSSNGNVIMLNPMHTIDEQKEAIIHEIQHAIQGIENFANGSNLEYWKNLGYSDEEAMAMYYNTAGEREARDVSARRDYNAEQRKNIRPDIDRKDVVFANDEYVRYSADEKSIEKYSDKEKENWQSSKNILIYRDNEQFEDFITKSLNNDINKKIYIGKISSKLGEFIYSKTGLNISGYNLVLRSSEIRKILKYNHGNEIKENLRGQRAIVKSDFLNFAKIITNPDEIYLGDKKFENKPVIIFIKTINGKTTAVTYVSAKHHDLTLQTRYSGKNKESLATTPSENKSLSQTSETLSGTASYKILAHEDNKVNIKENDNVSDIKYATDDTIQSEKYDNLETLDDKEIKVYNKRGWAYGLFNREDMKLLNEKFSELDKRLNGKTDNMLADGTRVVEINNKIVSIGGTYNDPEIYSVFEINAYHEYEAERIKDDIKYGQTGNGRNRYSFEGLGKLIENYKGKENVRFYSSTDYSYIRGRTEKGARAISTGDFSRYGYNKESNIRGTSDANAKGEVSAVQLDEDTSDIKYATDDTINDWLDDESTPQGIDYEKAVEKNPVIAVAKIYKSAAQTAKSGLAQGKNVKLDEKEYLRIAGSIMQTYGIKGKYNPNYKKELASQLKNFVDSIGKNDANFTDLFEELVNDCKGSILLSGEYDTTLMKDEREFVLDLIHDKTLFIRPRDIQQIEEDYGSVANYRKKMFGKTYVAVKNKESGKWRLTNLQKCLAMQRITLR